MFPDGVSFWSQPEIYIYTNEPTNQPSFLKMYSFIKLMWEKTGAQTLTTLLPPKGNLLLGHESLSEVLVGITLSIGCDKI